MRHFKHLFCFFLVSITGTIVCQHSEPENPFAKLGQRLFIREEETTQKSHIIMPNSNLPTCPTTRQSEGFTSEASDAPTPSESSRALVLYVEQGPLQRFNQRKKTVLLKNGLKISLVQEWQKHGVAGVVWDAALVLSEYLTENSEIVRGKRVLELGAGLGVPSITAASLDASEVISTDLPSAIPILSKNLKLNSEKLEIPPGKLGAKSLVWGKNGLQNFKFFPQIILAADVIYDESVFDDLLETFQFFLENSPESATESVTALLACRIRYDRDRQFLEKFFDAFNVVKVLYDSDTDVNLYMATNKV